MKMSKTIGLGLCIMPFAVGMALAAPIVIDDAAVQAGVTSTAAATSREVSPGAIAQAQAKMARAQQIVDRLAPQAASEGFETDGWRIELMTAVLMKNSEAGFAAAESAAGIHAAISAVHAAAATSAPATSSASAKALGDAGTDLVFVPLASPCRIVDTRVSGAGGPIAAGSSRTFIYAGGQTSQGGSGCSAANIYNIPVAAVNVTVVAPVGPAGASGNLRVYPTGTSTTTSFLNYVVGGIIANAGIVDLKVNAGNVFSQFDVFSQYQTNVIVDAFGAFEPPNATALQCTVTTGVSITLNTTTRNGQASAAACPSGYTRVSTHQGANGDYANIYSQTLGDGYAYWYYGGTTSVTPFVYAKCCRVPGQ